MQQVVVARVGVTDDEEDERIRRIGKANLDKWLQMLPQNTEYGALTDAGQGKLQIEIEGFDASRTPHCSTLICASTKQIRSPSSVAMKANTGLKKNYDSQLLTDGLKSKVDM